MRFSNYTLDSGVDYKIVINNLNIENAKNLGESAEGKLSASSDTTYKFVATEDKVYNFTDTKVSEDVKEFSIYDNDLNNIYRNRDIVWMALELIRRLISQCNFFEAQRLLERISTCNTFCTKTLSKFNNKVKTGGCNC